MENNLTKQQSLTAEQMYAFAANLYLHQDKNVLEVKNALIEQGVGEDTAQHVAQRLEQEIEEARKSRANKDMLYGGLWCGGGLLVTLLTYSAASGGGSYVVAYGAIIFGGIQFVRGLINSQK